jgi:uncharacterized phage infection (PIP) family protein YhgE
LFDRTSVGGNQQTESSNSETDRIRETVEENQVAAQRLRRNFDRHIEECASNSRRVYVLWAVVVLLALSLAGVSWYLYSDLNKSRPLLTDLPALQKLTGAMGDRVTAVEGSLKNWTSDRASMTDQMAKLETSMSSNLKTARNQARSLVTDMGQRIRQEVGQSVRALQNRIAGVESVQHETQDHVSQLQSEIGNLRQEVASLQQQNALQLSELKQASKSDMDRINNQVSNHSEKLKALTDQVDRQRVPFEVNDNQTHQIAPAIYLTIKHTDVAHQRVDGWMQLAAEGRILWIRGLGAQESFPFATRADNRTQALVITHIGRTGASGYLLVPTPAETTSVSDAASK